MQKENLGAEFQDLKVRVELVRDGDYHVGPVIKCSKDAGKLMQYLVKKDREHFICIHLNTRNIVVGIETVAIGTLNACGISSREVFKAAILSSAAGVILVHNHVSGNPLASEDDVEITKGLVKSGKILGIEVLDHIIIGDKEHFSFKDRGMI